MHSALRAHPPPPSGTAWRAATSEDTSQTPRKALQGPKIVQRGGYTPPPPLDPPPQCNMTIAGKIELCKVVGLRTPPPPLF